MNKLIPELLLRVLCDIHPIADAALLYAHTKENQDSVLEKGVELLNNGQVNELWISGSESKSGYLGVDVWRDLLIDRGVTADKVKDIPTNGYDMLNTYIEAFEAIRYAKTNAVKSLIVVSAPFHQLRAFATIVTAVTREYPELKAYSRPGTSLSWLENVPHSQGTLMGTRDEFIYTELERIDKYHKMGDLLALEDVAAYLRKRDIAP